MKRFLLITQKFPPFGGGGVQRMVKFATYLKQEGWRATVVCPNHKNDTWLDFERLKEIDDIETIRIGYRNFKNDSLLTKAFRKLYPIDSYFGWALEVVKVLRKKDLSIYDIILTSSPPSTTHLVGLFLSKNSKMKWVADFRDHYTLGPEYKAKYLKKSLDEIFERRIYKRANAIILNTAINKEEILASIPDVDEKKIHVIYNGFDYADLQQTDSFVNWKQGDVKHYLYLGGLRGDSIDGSFYRVLAGAFYKVASLRNELQIHVVGDHSRKGNVFHELGITDVIDFLDPVAYNSVADYLTKADGCLTWQSPKLKYRGTISGKFFDYLGMRKPVFSLGQDDGEIAKILNRYQIGISVNPQNIEFAANKFIEFHEKVKSNFFDLKKIDDSWLNKFNRVEQSRQLAKIFNQLNHSLT